MGKGHSQDSAGRQGGASVSAVCFTDDGKNDGHFRVDFQGVENKSEAFLGLSMEHAQMRHSLHH